MIIGAIKRLMLEVLAASSVPTPPASVQTIFADSADSSLKVKDGNGRVYALTATGVPNVVASNLQIPAGNTVYVAQYGEVASGVTLELGTGAFYEVG